MLRRCLQNFLLVVEDDKVVNDGVDGQRDGYHPAQKAHGCVALAQSGFGVDIAIAHCGHCDDGPPKRLRDAPE